MLNSDSEILTKTTRRYLVLSKVSKAAPCLVPNSHTNIGIISDTFYIESSVLLVALLPLYTESQNISSWPLLQNHLETRSL